MGDAAAATCTDRGLFSEGYLDFVRMKGVLTKVGCLKGMSKFSSVTLTILFDNVSAFDSNSLKSLQCVKNTNPGLRSLLRIVMRLKLTEHLQYAVDL